MAGVVVRIRKKEIMKKIILVVAMVVISTVATFAQSKQKSKSPEERTEKIVEKMKTDLALSDDQVVKVKPIILKREQKREEFRAQMNSTKDQHRQIAKETDEDFKKVLTPEQIEKLKAHRKEMREKHKEHMNNKGKG